MACCWSGVSSSERTRVGLLQNTLGSAAPAKERDAQWVLIRPAVVGRDRATDREDHRADEHHQGEQPSDEEEPCVDKSSHSDSGRHDRDDENYQGDVPVQGGSTMFVQHWAARAEE